MPSNRMNGQTALRKPFQIGGTIKLAGPDFEGSCKQRISEAGVELDATVEHASQEKVVELALWFTFREADVEIAVEYPEDCNPAEDALGVSFKGALGRELELNINSAQARALNEILTNFVRACDAWEGLKKVYPVSAPATA